MIEEIIKKAIVKSCGEGFVGIEPVTGSPWNAYCISEQGGVRFVDEGYLKFLEDVKKELEREGLTHTEFYQHVESEVKRLEDLMKFIYEVLHKKRELKLKEMEKVWKRK